MSKKLTKNELKKIVREELIKEGFIEDYKKFQGEYKQHNDSLKEKAKALNDRKKHMKAVGLVNQKISEIVETLKKLPATEVLESVKKSNGNKYQRAVAMFEDILENTKGWLKENQ